MGTMNNDAKPPSDPEHPDLSPARTVALLETLAHAAKDARMLKARIDAAEEDDREWTLGAAARRRAGGATRS